MLRHFGGAAGFLLKMTDCCGGLVIKLIICRDGLWRVHYRGLLLLAEYYGVSLAIMKQHVPQRSIQNMITTSLNIIIPYK